MGLRVQRVVVGVAVVASLVAAGGCSSKSNDTSSGPSGSASGGSVKTGEGISGNEITLGQLTDLTGVFASLGKDVTNAQALFWEQQNAKGGVCGKYKVKLLARDHGYVVQNAVSLFSAMKGQVLAMQQLLGSPENTALNDQISANKLVDQDKN